MDNLNRGSNINLHPTAVFVHAFRSRNCVSPFFVALVQTKYKREDSSTYTGPRLSLGTPDRNFSSPYSLCSFFNFPLLACVLIMAIICLKMQKQLRKTLFCLHGKFRAASPFFFVFRRFYLAYRI